MSFVRRSYSSTIIDEAGNREKITTTYSTPRIQLVESYFNHAGLIDQFLHLYLGVGEVTLDLIYIGHALRDPSLALIQHSQQRRVGPTMQRKRHNRESHDVHGEELFVKTKLLRDFSGRIGSGDKVQTEHKV